MAKYWTSKGGSYMYLLGTFSDDGSESHCNRVYTDLMRIFENIFEVENMENRSSV